MRKHVSSVGRARTRALFLAGALALALLPLAPAGAGGTATCTYTGGEVNVDLQNNGSSGILSRDNLGVIQFSDGNTPAAQPCGVATTATTNQINIEDTSNGGSTSIILDIRNGHFANGGNEIPIKVDLGAGSIDSFGVVGGGDNDRWTFGRTKGNLQDDTDGEIEFETLPDFGFGTPQGGSDKVCASGGRGTGNSSLIGWVFLGGANNDNLCGSLVTDRLNGNGGDDTVRGMGGSDTVKGKGGNDRLRGNGGPDTLTGNKGADDLNGGPGTDTCNGGPGADQKGRCERR